MNECIVINNSDDVFLYDNYIKLSVISMVFYSLLEKFYKKKKMITQKIQTDETTIDDTKKQEAAEIIQNTVLLRIKEIKQNDEKANDEKQNDEKQNDEKQNDEKQNDEKSNDEKANDECSAIDNQNKTYSYLSYIPVVNYFYPE